MRIFLIILASILAVIAIIVTFIFLVWKIAEKYSPYEAAIGKVIWIQKSKIPGFKQVYFSYTKKGRPHEVSTLLIWHKKKFKLKGMYKIQVYHRKIKENKTISWAIPMSNHRVANN